jgi:TfoX/Sxy family transcriptional regulator of competence genes
VAYDDELADRIRDLLEGDPGVTERKMFGGLAFLVFGNMAVAVSAQGGILARVHPAEADRLIARTNAEMAILRNRPMQGWLRIHPEDLGARRQLAKWVTLSSAYAHALPPKR